jgi:ubiquinone biosynthesis protein COQ4
MAAPYEELLALPLHEVRAKLGISPTAIAHPAGHFFTRWQLPSSDIPPYEPWNYEASLAESA